jgi:hypothetical protein
LLRSEVRSVVKETDPLWNGRQRKPVSLPRLLAGTGVRGVAMSVNGRAVESPLAALSSATRGGADMPPAFVAFLVLALTLLARPFRSKEVVVRCRDEGS